MEYRIATKAECPQLAQMRWDFKMEDGEVSLTGQAEFLAECLAFLEQGYEGGSWTYWIAEQSGQVISHVFVHKIRPVPRPARLTSFYGYVTNVYTKPGYRNQGIGTVLLRQVKGWARTQGFLLLFVSPSEASVSFYTRAGFRGDTEWMNLELDPA